MVVKVKKKMEVIMTRVYDMNLMITWSYNPHTIKINPENSKIQVL